MCRDPAAPSGEAEIWVDYKAIKGRRCMATEHPGRGGGRRCLHVLMSIDYDNSNFCMKEEMSRMLLKRQQGKARVIGVALHELRLGDFRVDDGANVLRLDEVQCLPQGQIVKGMQSRLGLKPVNQWSDRRDAWCEVRCQIEAALAGAPTHVPEAQTVAAAPAASVPAPAISAPAYHPPADAARLPFLCNRSDQIYLLAERLEAWEQAGSRRPLLVLTEGRYADCVQEWVERMHGSEIATALAKLFNAQGISFGQPRHFVWPTVAANPAMAAKRLRASFATALGLPLMTPIGEVQSTQATPGLPALWWTECADDDGAGETPLHVLQGLLSMLGDWPDLDPRSTLVVALTLVRDGTAPANGRARLGATFESLLHDADATGRVACVTLGSLPEVDGPAVTAWSRDPRIAPWLKAPPSALAAQLPAAQMHWPMRTFADMASGWLRAA